MVQKNSFIVIEGVDGAGKTTQVKLLEERFRQSGRATAYIHFPQHEESFFGRFIDRYLRGEFGHPDQIDSHFIAHAYLADFFEAKANLEVSLAQGKIVLCDRYLPSTLAIQTIHVPEEARAQLREWIETAAYKVYNIVRPSLVIVIDLPAEKAHKMIAKKQSRQYLNGGSRDIHEADISFLAEMRKNYLELAGLHDWPVIDSMAGDRLKSLEEIHEEVWDILLGHKFLSHL